MPSRMLFFPEDGKKGPLVTFYHLQLVHQNDIKILRPLHLTKYISNPSFRGSTS